MKKKNLILAGLLLSLCMGTVTPVSCVFAATVAETAEDTDTSSDDGEMSWVFDDCGILTDEQAAEINDELATIYETYGYDAVLFISQDIDEDEDNRQYAAEFMQDNEIGYGDTHEGMCIFHQPNARNITIVFRGDTQDDFSERIQEDMLDKCKTYLKADDPYGGYQSLISDLTAGLDRIAEGKKIRPLDLEGGSVASYLFADILMAFVIMAIPTALLTWYQVRKMKTRV